MRKQNVGFHYRSTLDLSIEYYKRALISIPSLYGERADIQAKDLVSSGPVSSVGKHTTEEHLHSLISRGELDAECPLLVIGLRNTLVNYRCVAQVGGKLYSIPPEIPQNSQRPYYGIAIDAGGRISCTTRSWQHGFMHSNNEVFVSGVPTGWENLSQDELKDTMLIEAFDHSHLYKLARGNHPDATSSSRAHWKNLNSVFIDSIHQDSETAAKAMYTILNTGPPLVEECNYLHQVIGCNSDEQLYICVAHASLASIGCRLGKLGYNRSVCVENSGSVQPSFFPNGANGPEIQLLRAPNSRPVGRALLVIELENSNFKYLNY